MADPMKPLEPTSAAGDAGGGITPEAELEAVEAALKAVPEDDTEGRESDDEPGTTEAKPSRVQRRIKGLIDQRRSYERFGKPEEIEARFARLKQYEALEARITAEQEAEHQAERVKSGATDRAARFRELLDETFGEGSSVRWQDTMASQADVEARVNSAHAKSAREQLTSVLEANAITPAPNVVQAAEHVMSTYIQSNPELHAKYLDPATQGEAIAASFKFLRSNFIDPVLAAANAGTLEAIVARKSRALGSGRGSSAETIENDEPPKNATAEERVAWHKSRVSRGWDAVIEADEAV